MHASLAVILDGVADGVILCDHRGVVRSANEAAAVMFGRAQDEFRGLDVRELAPSFDPRNVLSPLGNGSESPMPQRVAWELQGVRKDGTTFAAELTVGALRLGSQRIYAAVVRDVSLRKEREAEARRLLEIEIAEEERVRLVHREARERQRLLDYLHAEDPFDRLCVLPTYRRHHVSEPRFFHPHHVVVRVDP